MSYRYYFIEPSLDFDYEKNIAIIEQNRNKIKELNILKKIAKEDIADNVIIEGNSLNKDQIQQFLIDEITVRGVPLKDHLQVYNLSVSIESIFSALQNKDFLLESENIKSMHAIATAGELGVKECGQFRQEPVHIRGTEYIPPMEFEVPDLVQELCDNYNRPLEHQTQFERICEFKMNFEKIHPFIDGNGRTGRLIMNNLLLQEGYGYMQIPSELRIEYFKSIENLCFNEFAAQQLKLKKK